MPLWWMATDVADQVHHETCGSSIFPSIRKKKACSGSFARMVMATSLTCRDLGRGLETARRDLGEVIFSKAHLGGGTCHFWLVILPRLCVCSAGSTSARQMPQGEEDSRPNYLKKGLQASKLVQSHTLRSCMGSWPLRLQGGLRLSATTCHHDQLRQANPPPSECNFRKISAWAS